MQIFIDTHRQAIQTKTHPCTETKGTRISASYAGGRIYISADMAGSWIEAHRDACEALVKKLGWEGDWSGSWFEGCCYWSQNK